MSDGATILLTISGTAAGGIVSWFLALKSGSDLKTALRRLDGNHHRQLQAANALARMLEESGIGKPSYDGAGNLTGIAITASAHAGAGFSDGVAATVIKEEPPRYDRQHEQPPSPEPEGNHA